LLDRVDERLRGAVEEQVGLVDARQLTGADGATWILRDGDWSFCAAVEGAAVSSGTRRRSGSRGDLQALLPYEAPNRRLQGTFTR
jgi:hypothetical protein